MRERALFNREFKKIKNSLVEEGKFLVFTTHANSALLGKKRAKAEINGGGKNGKETGSPATRLGIFQKLGKHPPRRGKQPILKDTLQLLLGKKNSLPCAARGYFSSRLLGLSVLISIEASK